MQVQQITNTINGKKTGQAIIEFDHNYPADRLRKQNSSHFLNESLINILPEFPTTLMSIETPKYITETVKSQMPSYGPKIKAPLGMGMMRQNPNINTVNLSDDEIVDTEIFNDKKYGGSCVGYADPKSLISIKTPKNIPETLKSQILSDGPQIKAPQGMDIMCPTLNELPILTSQSEKEFTANTNKFGENNNTTTQSQLMTKVYFAGLKTSKLNPFRFYGKVLKIYIQKDENTGLKTGNGFVIFDGLEPAVKLKHENLNHRIFGNEFKILFSTTHARSSINENEISEVSTSVYTYNSKSKETTKKADLNDSTKNSLDYSRNKSYKVSLDKSLEYSMNKSVEKSPENSSDSSRNKSYNYVSLDKSLKKSLDKSSNNSLNKSLEKLLDKDESPNKSPNKSLIKIVEVCMCGIATVYSKRTLVLQLHILCKHP